MDAIIGIHDWEKQKKQPLFFDLKLYFDCRKAAKSDDIKDALDYFEVCQKVTAFVANSRFELIEALAESVCQLVFKHFKCDKIKLTVLKPEAIADAESVGISITRKVN